MTVVAALVFEGGSWITLPKGAKVVDVRGVALILKDSIGDAIVVTGEDIAMGLVCCCGEAVGEDISFNGMN